MYEDICSTPFLDLDSPLTAYEWAKFVLYIPFLLIRICLVCLLLPPVMITTHLVVAGQPHNQPLSSAKARFLRPFLRFWARLLMVLGLNFYHSVKGREHIAEAYKVQCRAQRSSACSLLGRTLNLLLQARALLVINHVSYLDALVMGEAFLPCGLAKVTSAAHAASLLLALAAELTQAVCRAR